MSEVRRDKLRTAGLLGYIIYTVALSVFTEASLTPIWQARASGGESSAYWPMGVKAGDIRSSA